MRASEHRAVHAGQHEVEQDQVGRVLAHQPQRLLALAGDHDLVAILGKVVAQQLDDVAFVFNDQDAFAVGSVHAVLLRLALA